MSVSTCKLFLGVLVTLLLVLQFKLWLGDFGIIRYWQLQDSVQSRVELNQALERRNDQLRAEVFDLKHGTEALEERARSQLGMIRKGELFYQVVDPQG